MATPINLTPALGRPCATAVGGRATNAYTYSLKIRDEVIAQSGGQVTAAQLDARPNTAILAEKLACSAVGGSFSEGVCSIKMCSIADADVTDADGCGPEIRTIPLVSNGGAAVDTAAKSCMNADMNPEDLLDRIETGLEERDVTIPSRPAQPQGIPCTIL